MNMCALGCRLLKSLECSSADDYRSANNASVMLKAQIHPQEQVTTFSIISCLTQCPPLPSFPLLLNRLLPSFPVKDNGTAERGSPCNHRFLAALYIKPTPALQRKLACLFPSPHALHALPYRDGNFRVRGPYRKSLISIKSVCGESFSNPHHFRTTQQPFVD